MLAEELGGRQVDQPLVPVVSAQPHVAVGGQGEELAAADLHDGDVEGAPAQVVDQDAERAVGAAAAVEEALLKSEGHGRRGGLVDDVQHLEARHVAGVLGRLAADLVEVGRHGDHDLVERADLLGAVDAELVEDPGLQHLGGVVLALQHLVEDAIAHVALDAFGHVLALGDHGFHRFLADDHVGAVDEHDAGRDAVALGVDEGDGPALLVQMGQHRVRRSQIDADGGSRSVCHALD